MSTQPEIWVIDDDRSIRWVLEKALSQAQLLAHTFETADKALARLKRDKPAVIITDIRMPGTDGLAFLEQVQATYPQMPVIVMTAYADLDRAVAAFQGGAFEYLPKPFDVDEAVAIVRRALAKVLEDGAPPPPVIEAPKLSTNLIGGAPAMQEVFRAIGRLSKSNMTVLLTG